MNSTPTSSTPTRTRRARGARGKPPHGRRPGTGRSASGSRKPPAIHRNIVWLASYPKSGNTWTRIFLANYLLNAEAPVPINQVSRIGTGDAVSINHRIVAGGSYDPQDHIGHHRLRDRVLRAVTNNDADMNFLKSHNTSNRVQGIELVPARYTRSALYLLRNPLDVAVSYARHYALSTADTVERLARKDTGIASDSHNVWQYLGNWSEHVQSWVNARDIPVHAMRYEDMKEAPHETFTAMLEFLGVPVDPERVDRAVRFSSFEIGR